MERPIYQYQPTNTNPDVAIGILLPFNKSIPGKNIHDQFGQTDYTSGSLGGGSVFESSYSTEEQVISNLKNLILTRKGERIMQPTFGTDIQKSLFEPNTDQLEIELEESITSDIKFWLPYVIVNGVDVIRNINNHSINIRIRFRITESGANMVIMIFADENVITASIPELDSVQLELEQIGTIQVL